MSDKNTITGENTAVFDSDVPSSSVSEPISEEPSKLVEIKAPELDTENESDSELSAYPGDELTATTNSKAREDNIKRLKEIAKERKEAENDQATLMRLDKKNEDIEKELIDSG